MPESSSPEKKNPRAQESPGLMSEPRSQEVCFKKKRYVHAPSPTLGGFVTRKNTED